MTHPRCSLHTLLVAASLATTVSVPPRTTGAQVRASGLWQSAPERKAAPKKKPARPASVTDATSRPVAPRTREAAGVVDPALGAKPAPVTAPGRAPVDSAVVTRAHTTDSVAVKPAPTVAAAPSPDSATTKPAVAAAPVPKVDSVAVKTPPAAAPTAPARVGLSVDALAVQVEFLTRRVDSLNAAQKSAAQQVSTVEKNLVQRISGLGNFRFTGDVRVRYEGQRQDGGFVTRHRERSRARLGITGNLSETITGGVGIASGALDDVQSANQTQTGFFSRKPIGFDRFFVQWKPKVSYLLSVQAGKFTYPWERTSLTWGNDINPEGAALSLGRAYKGQLQGVSVVGFVLPMLEVSGGRDSYVTGAQLQTRWKLNPRTNARASIARVSFHGADDILAAATAGTIKPSSATTNSVRLDAAGKVVGYATHFSQVDAIAAVDYTRTSRWPLTVLANVVENRRADEGQRRGFLGEARFGRLSQLNDWQVAWTSWHIQRDAVIGGFNEQDLRAATNVQNHRASFSWQWRPNAALNAALWHGRLLQPGKTPSLTPPEFRPFCTRGPVDSCRDPWLSRLQVDLTYKY